MFENRGDDSAWANSLCGELIVRTLAALGVKHFVVSPGSRSSPLTMAMDFIAREQYSVVLDERSAAFQALGRIKATRSPVALICTSGSAVAHYFPAIIEARESGLPLIVLTADRPPELRSCHAGQTIDQVKIYGSYPVFETELPIPEASQLLFRQVREICRTAVNHALSMPGGPVHVNCPFREPFMPQDGNRPEFDHQLIDGLKVIERAQSRARVSPQLPAKTVILAGPRPGIDSVEEINALMALSRKNGWPILADASNPVRYSKENSCQVIVQYDRVARDPYLWKTVQPEAVIQWGEPPTSKVLRQQLMDMDLQGYLISDSKKSINPSHGKIEWVCSSVVDFSASCTGKTEDYQKQWLRAEKQMQNKVEDAFNRPHDLFEGDLHRALASTLPEFSTICFANSLAIRDAEWFMPAVSKAFLPFSQRGANGIDGTVSLARGIAQGLRKPVYLVTGDLALLHDAGGLLGQKNDDFGLFIILINNQGGGIFELLPVSRQFAGFEELFAAPQDIEFPKLVEAYGGLHQLHTEVGTFAEHIRNWNGKGLNVAEFRIDRKQSRDLHREHLKFNK